MLFSFKYPELLTIYKALFIMYGCLLSLKSKYFIVYSNMSHIFTLHVAIFMWIWCSFQKNFLKRIEDLRKLRLMSAQRSSKVCFLTTKVLNSCACITCFSFLHCYGQSITLLRLCQYTEQTILWYMYMCKALDVKSTHKTWFSTKSGISMGLKLPITKFLSFFWYEFQSAKKIRGILSNLNIVVSMLLSSNKTFNGECIGRPRRSTLAAQS